MSAAATAQLPLPFAASERNTFAHFVVGGNGELVERLRARPPGFASVWVFGTPGVGKTHLLQAFCHTQQGSAYIPAARVDAATTSLVGYAEFSAVAVDDVELWLGERRGELALFDLYNQLAAMQAQLLVAARRSPLETEFAVPDLGSRLRAAACYRVAPLMDGERRQLLAGAARRRSLSLGPEVANYLLAHVDRDQRELLRILDVLDRSSLAAGRRLTIPFVKQVLGL